MVKILEKEFLRWQKSQDMYLDLTLQHIARGRKKIAAKDEMSFFTDIFMKWKKETEIGESDREKILRHIESRWKNVWWGLWMRISEVLWRMCFLHSRNRRNPGISGRKRWKADVYVQVCGRIFTSISI